MPYKGSFGCGGAWDGSTPSNRLETDSPAWMRAMASAKRRDTVRTCSSGQPSGAGTVSVVTTDTVPPPADWPELKVRTVSRLFAEAIARIHAGESVSSLFDGVDPAHAPPQPKLPL